jgi:hypothetical protein
MGRRNVTTATPQSAFLATADCKFLRRNQGLCGSVEIKETTRTKSWGQEQWKTEHFSCSRPALPSSNETAIKL